MSKFVMYKLKDGRRIRGRYDYDTDKVFISSEDLEGLLNESNVAYEQAKQLQTIIENLEEIKAETARKALDKIRAEIEDWQTDIHDNEYDAKDYDFVFEQIFEIIDKYINREVEE